jgi:aminoglycoside 3-N-acetyltransferase
MQGQRLLLKCRKRLQQWLNPISPTKLQQTIDALIPRKMDVLLMHSSLSSCGRFTGGPRSIIESVSRRTSNLVMPTHTYTYPEAQDSEGPVFDANATASRNGMLTNLFRTSANVVRSIHATHSLAASGPLATELTSGHWLSNTACGRNTPYQRLLDRHAGVLMFGVSLHSYTLFHTAEDAADSPCAYEVETCDRLRVRDEYGQIRVCLSKRQSRVPRRFAEAGENLVTRGMVQKVPLGRSHLYFVPDCMVVHEYLLERLRTFPDYLYYNCSVNLNS